jgi:hypothetical protein
VAEFTFGCAGNFLRLALDFLCRAIRDHARMIRAFANGDLCFPNRFIGSTLGLVDKFAHDHSPEGRAKRATAGDKTSETHLGSILSAGKIIDECTMELFLRPAIIKTSPFLGLRKMIDWFRCRYLELVGSIYIYNEHRGYTAIDRVLEAVMARAPDDIALIAAIEKHRADERKHYEMFRRWFELRKVMPFAVDRTCGHIDRFVEIMFRSTIDDLDTAALIKQDDLFERLCRVIALTERRGYRQVDTLLRHPLVRSDKALIKIFRIIEKDEPSHWAPYEGWLRVHGKRDPRWWEHAIDSFIHSELLFLKLPALFLTPRLSRRTEWADAREVGEPQSLTTRLASVN